MKLRTRFKDLFLLFIAEIINLFLSRQGNFWLFSSSYNTKFNYNSKYLFLYMLEYHPEIKARFVINDDQKRQKLQKEYGDYFIETKSLKGIIEALRAGYWFTSVGFPINILFAKKQRKVINLWHGAPFKKIALKQNNLSWKKNFLIRLFFSRNFTHIITTSQKLSGVFAESFDISESKIQILGQPRNDLALNNINKKDWLNNKYDNLPKFKHIILYAPTFREFGKTILFPFPDINPQEFSRFLENEKLLVFIRFHQSEKQNGLDNLLKESDRILFINEEKVEDIMEIINAFDLLITDYSSIYIDHLLTQKPQLFFPYDLKEYEKKRGFNFSFEEFTPGPKPKSQNEFFKELIKLLKDPSYYASKRHDINEFFNEIKKDNCKNIVEFFHPKANRFK